MDQTLGIVVNSVDHPDYVIQLARAAKRKGKTVRIHFTGAGVRLADGAFVAELCELARVSICRESAAEFGCRGLPAESRGVEWVPASTLVELITDSDRHVVF